MTQTKQPPANPGRFNATLLEDYHRKQLHMELDVAHRLYRERDASFRGFRST